MMQPIDILKNQIANLIGENAKLFCDCHNQMEEIRLLRKQVADLSIKKEDVEDPKPGGITRIRDGKVEKVADSVPPTMPEM